MRKAGFFPTCEEKKPAFLIALCPLALPLGFYYCFSRSCSVMYLYRYARISLSLGRLFKQSPIIAFIRIRSVFQTFITAAWIRVLTVCGDVR